MRKTLLQLTLLLIIFTVAIYAQVDVTATGGTASASYSTLKGAFDKINDGTHQGTITLNLSDNTTETASAVLNASGSGTASYTTVLIQPSGGGSRTITGSLTAPLIDLNGADSVIIDGLNSGGNTLTISNTNTGTTSTTSTIRFIADATKNTVKNCSILGSATGTTTANTANIFFSTAASGGTGNDNNTIDNCDIGPAGSNLPLKAIYSNGTTTAASNYNSSNIIKNCRIYDWFNSTNASYGIYISTGSTDFTIQDNKFYQTSSRAIGAAVTHYVLYLSSSTAGNNFLISGNTIGYSASNATGTYTLTSTFGAKFVPVFMSVASATASSVQGNTITAISLSTAASGTSTSGPFMGIYVSSGLVYIGNVTGNTIGSMTATGAITYASTTSSANDFYGIYSFPGANSIVNNNNIGGITINGSGNATNFYGIRFNTGTSYWAYAVNNTIGGDVDNSIYVNQTGTAVLSYGIFNSNASSRFFQNTIRNITSASANTSTGSSSSMGGIHVQKSSASTAVDTISQNLIYNLANTTGTASVTVNGMHYGFANSSGTNIVERNYVHSISVSSSGTAAQITGLNVNGGITNYRNNFIRLGIDGRGNALSNGLVLKGIYEGVGTDNFYFNSVYVGGSSVGGSAATYAFHSAVTTNTRAFQNNIFQNSRSNGSGTGKHYIIWLAGTTANPSGLTCNYNVYYGNGTGGVFGYFNSADVADLAAWKTAVGKDANSFSSDPQFLNPAGDASTGNLHLSPTLVTVAEGNGLDIASVTNDYDGQARSGLTPVDIGADAGNFTGTDMTGPAISYTAMGATTSLSNRNFTGVTITDLSGVNTTSGTRPRVYYKKTSNSNALNDNTSGTEGWKWVEANGTSSPFDFTIDYSKLYSSGTVSVGDTLQYFVIAQDLATTPNVSMVSGTFAVAPTSVELTSGAFPVTGTINNYTFLNAISGTKSIPGDYATLTGAGGLFATINSSVVTGNITVNIAGNLSEDAVNALNQWTEEGAGNYTLTIQPDGTTPRFIVSGAANHMIRLNGADRVTINGGSGKYLTFRDTNTSYSPIYFTNAANNNTVTNCYLEANTTGSNGVVYFGTGANTGNTISDCELRGRSDVTGYPAYGIYFADVMNSGNTIFRNKIVNFTSYGVYISSGSGTIIDSNEIYQNVTSSSSTIYGIYFANTGTTETKIRKNKIFGLNGAAAATIKGIYSPGASGINTQVSVENNMISLSPVTTGTVAGIDYYGYTANSLNIYYNSVYLGGTLASGTNNSWGIYKRDAATTFHIRNNAVHNARTNSGATAKHYAIAITNTTATTMSSNYNDFYANGTGGVLGVWSTTDAATIADWKTNSTRDTNSISADPLFTSSADLHIPTSATSPVDGAANPLAGITTDLDGAARNASTPDIGADEYTYVPPSVDPPAALAADPYSQSMQLTFTPNGSSHNVVIVWNNTGTFSDPSGPPPSVGDDFAGGKLLYNGTSSPQTHSGLTTGTSYYYKAFSYNGSSYSPGISANATTGVLNPTGVTATAIDGSQIDLGWTKNAHTDNVMVVWNSTSTFGVPVNGTNYNAGDAVTGGGTVAYKGAGTTFNHTSLTSGTTYYYKVFSVDGTNYYSSGSTANATTYYGIPYNQNFNASTSLPTGWSGTMTVASNHGTSGSNGLKFNLYSSYPSFNALTPVMATVTSATTLSFDYRIVDYTSYPTTATTLTASDSMVIKVSTDGGTTYDHVIKIDQSNHTSSLSFANKSVSLSGYNGKNIKVQVLGYWGAGDYYFNLDNFAVSYPTVPNAATVVSPTNGATNVSKNTALNWASGNGATETGYKLYFGTDNPPTNIVNGTSTTPWGTSYTPASPLSYNTTYYWKIVPFNGEGDATGATIWSFTTSSDPTRSLPFSEGWESGSVPWYWSTYYNATGGALGTNTVGPFAGTYDLRTKGLSTSPTYTTPSGLANAWTLAQVSSGSNAANTRYADITVDLTGNEKLSFYYTLGSSTFNVNYNNFWVLIDSAGTWVQLYGRQGLTSTVAYTLQEVNLAGWSGNKTIRFFHNSKYDSDYLGLDSISIATQPNMAYSSSTTTQNTNSVATNVTNQQVIGIQVVTTGSANPINATSFSLNTTGTTAPSTDITNAKLFSTGTSGTFATTTQFGSTVASPNGLFSFSDTKQLSEGTNYFWLTYDVPSGATPGNVIDGECTSVTVGGSAQTPSVTAPSGSRTIVGPLTAATYTVGISAFNKAAGKQIYAKTEKKKVVELVPRYEDVVVEKNQVTNTEIQKIGSINLEERRFIGYEEVTVEKDVVTLMENGKPYEGSLTYYPPKSAAKSGKEETGDEPKATYGTLTAAIADLNLRGVSGAVVFSLIDATYPSETFPIVIEPISGSSASNTVTIKPAAGVAATITGSNAAAILKLNGADYVTIDGLNTGGSSLTVENTSTGTSAVAVWLASASASDGTTNNTVRRCTIIGGASSTTLAGIMTSGTTAGAVAEAANNNNVIRDNIVYKAYYGIVAVGPTGNETGLTITGNTVGSVTSGDKIGNIGIAIFQQSDALVSGNTIHGVTTSGTNTVSGIKVTGTQSASVISNNTVRDIKNTSSSGWGSNGIWLASSTTTANVTVKNNFVSDVASYGYSTAGVSDNGYGMVIETGGGYNVYYNTVLNNTDQTALTGLPATIFLGLTQASGVDLRNNIFVNTQTLGTDKYAIYSASAATVYSYIDYNNYHTAGSNLGYLSSNRADLAAWKTATGKDAKSKSTAVTFTSATDLHLSGGSVGDKNLQGTPIAGITKDWDDHTRHVAYPYMGADEVTTNPLAMTLNLTVLIQGLMNPGNTAMVIGDTVTVYLRNATTPWAKVDSATAFVGTNGAGTFYFPGASLNATNYYMQIKHRNAIETWSAAANPFSSYAYTYNFTSDAAQAYGSNLIQKGSLYCLYNADANLDGQVSLDDLLLVDADNQNFVTGYTVTDMNGDDQVTLDDLLITDENNQNFVSKQSPAGLVAKPVKRTQTGIKKNITD